MGLPRDANSHITPDGLGFNIFGGGKIIKFNKEKKCVHVSLWKHIVFLPGMNSRLIANIWNVLILVLMS